MSKRFIQQVGQFMEIANVLHEKGVKKKEIANFLGVFPSVYSTMVNGVFPLIMGIAGERPNHDQEISEHFGKFNNISEKRVRREIDTYLERIKRLQLDQPSAGFKFQNTYIEHLIQQSPYEILKKLVGLYDCYYISSFGYKVKKEPFLIREEKGERTFTVAKGNNKGPTYLQGFLYLSNNHILTIQMNEIDTINPDNFMAHFLLPPSYSSSLNMLKGISVSVSNAYFPVGRKIILKKIQPKISVEDFLQLETVFFEKQELKGAPDIIQYLYHSNSLIEYIPIPHPSFDEQDLKKEMDIRKALYP